MAVADSQNALAAQTRLDSYLEEVSLISSQIGAGMSRVESAINALRSATVEIEQAKSRILDVDVALEAAKLLRLQVLQQATVALLAQSSQEHQLALKLLS